MVFTDIYLRYLLIKASGVKHSKSAIALISSLLEETKQSVSPNLAVRKTSISSVGIFPVKLISLKRFYHSASGVT
ncbi:MULTISPECIES: hypothetical protein [Okeania]|uniref:hypothetical protein n=1 Tax=Okeania TaxID=1458928 RepID=UPI0019611BCE|nr:MULTISPECIES: hypothetical protein [Okeania]